jgi:hypothetical protein
VKPEPKTQEQLVRQKMGGKDLGAFNIITERLYPPGIETLHHQSTDEIARTLTNIIKSRSSVRAITYVLGSHIELTSESDIVVNP